jgi:hypothetical protein
MHASVDRALDVRIEGVGGREGPDGGPEAKAKAVARVPSSSGRGGSEAGASNVAEGEKGVSIRGPIQLQPIFEKSPRDPISEKSILVVAPERRGAAQPEQVAPVVVAAQEHGAAHQWAQR